MTERISDKTEQRTDMAVELLEKEPRFRNRSGVKKTEVVVDARLSRRLNRPKGRYITLECAAPLSARREKYKPLIDDMAAVIRSLCEGCDSFLAVGVGNPLLTADALGSRTVSLLKTNRGLSSRGFSRELSAFSPGVSGVTGIESVDVVKSITSFVKPDCVIVIDSLASAAVSRLGTAFQLCDSGLVPGSGVGGGSGALSASSLKVKRVLSVGVPLVVYAETIVREAGAAVSEIPENVRNLLVTPKDIDLLMSECAHIIAEAINAALGL
ncbi:MAG: GPR endopeptidase [Clostridia bacterium]|nr:GPR endopeptidase [Clostridia bacterium]